MGKYKFDRTDKGLIIPISEVKKTIQGQTREWPKSLIAFLYIFGVRISEALDVKVKDIEFDHEEDLVGVTIRLGKKREAKGPYTQEIHTVWAPLETAFMPIFLRRLRARSKGGSKNSRLWPYTRQASWYHINKVNPELSHHVFRHSRLQHLADQGATPWELRDFAGWEDTRPAEDYVKRSKKRVKNLAKKF